jgi:hypothetical protein
MTGGGGAFKARGHPPIFFKNRFPPRPLARRWSAPSGPDSLVATRVFTVVLNHEDQQQEALMGMISYLSAQEIDTFAALVLGLEAEFGSSETTALAAYFVDAEAADIHWDARQMERHLGRYEGFDDDSDDLESVRIMGCLGECWFVATCLVDGNGAVHDMIRRRHFMSEGQAGEAFEGDG